MITNSQATLYYSVTFPEVDAHYVQIDIRFLSDEEPYHDFIMPVWTPGSYKIREFSQNVESLSASASSGKLEAERINKYTWRIHSSVKGEIRLKYKVYCFVHSVRQSYVDRYFAFLHGVSVFGYIDGHLQDEIIMDISPLPNWANIEVALPQLKSKGHQYRVKNYDLLADSPIALGNFETVEYESGKVLHRVVMLGEGNYDLKRIATDFKKISDVQIEMMGSCPAEPFYIHFIQNTDNGSGGLEHLNCHTSQMDRWAYTDKERYKKFLGLVSHEYFHLWNGKRIRPIELGPFDYTAENYTEMLWIVEGITSYYDDLFLHRVGIYDRDEYLKIVSSNISRYENTPGKTEMNLLESSKLTWIKYYMPNENANNTTISYYNKGMLVACLLDLTLLKENEQGLDEVLRYLFNRYKKEPVRGYTWLEFMEVCNSIAGKNINSFFDSLLRGKTSLNYEAFLSDFGIVITDKKANTKQCWTGVKSRTEGGKILITQIETESPAEIAGLSVNDELISLNGWRLTENLETEEKRYTLSDTLELEYSRGGKMYHSLIIPQRNPEQDWHLLVKKENVLLDRWLRISEIKN